MIPSLPINDHCQTYGRSVCHDVQMRIGQALRLEYELPQELPEAKARPRVRMLRPATITSQYQPLAIPAKRRVLAPCGTN